MQAFPELVRFRMWPPFLTTVLNVNVSYRPKEYIIGPQLGMEHGVCNPDVCGDQESNWCPSTLQDNAQPTESHQSGLHLVGALLCA